MNKITILITFLFLNMLVLPKLTGQSEACINFEELENNTMYGEASGLEPGDVMFEEAGVIVYLQEFLYFDGSTGFFNVQVTSDIFGDNFPEAEGQYVFPSNINMEYDFTELDGMVTSLCFDFFDGGGEENISVNGSPLLVLNDLSEAPEEIAPGVILSLTLDDNNNFPGGQLCLEGTIETLVFGGQEFALDNLCFTTAPVTNDDDDCIEFEEMEEEIYGTDAGNEQGEIIYTENNVPVQLIPMQGIDWLSYFGNLHVLNTEDYPELTTASDQYIGYDEISTAFNFSQFPEEVEKVTVDFFYNGGIINFAANGAPINVLLQLPAGFYNIGPGVDLEVAYGIDSGVGKLTFTGNIQSLLIGGADLRIDNFCINPVCTIENLTAETTPCSNEGTYFIEISFNYEHVSDSFYLWQNGNEIGLYAYSDLPVAVGPFQGPIDDPLEFLVFDEESDECFDVLTLDGVECIPPCSISELTVSQLPCNDDGNFFINLSFIVEYPEEGFNLEVNGELWNEYSYDDLPLEIGPFSPEDVDNLHFLVSDFSGDCAEDINWQVAPCAPVCTISDIIVEPYDCDDGFFLVDLAFESENTGPLGYLIFTDGTVSGPHSYDEPFITLGPFAGDGTTVYDFYIIDLANPTCFGYAEFGPYDCNPECQIYELVVDPGACNDEGNYSLFLNFQYNNPGNDFFEVFGPNNELIDFYPLSDLPLTIDNFLASGNNVDFVKVCINDQPDCCKTVEFEAPDCGNGGCQIFDLVVDPGNCNDDGTYSLYLNFEYENPGNDFFEVYGPGNELIDYYPLSELPLTIDHFPASGNDYDYLKVCINDNPDCCKIIEFPAPDCEGGDCHIFELTLEPLDCDGDGTFGLIVNFEHEGTSGLGFDVFSQNEFIGFYSYDDLPVTIENFPERVNSNSDIITICDNDNPNCCKTEEFFGPDCTGGEECQIFDLVVDPGNCNDDGTYSLYLNFEYENPGNDFFEVYGPGNELIDYYPLSELPLTIDHFPASGNDYDYLKVCINDNPDCCKIIEFPAPDCEGGDCHIFELTLEPLDCDGDGTFGLIVNFEHEGTSGLGFDVFSQNEFIGFYSYDDLPVTIENFPERVNSNSDIITICDNDNPNCCKTEEFFGPDCTNNGDCHIYDVVAEAQPCTPNGIFYVEISFEFNNVGNEGYKIIGNGQNYGTFSYNEPFPVLGPFNGSDDMIYEFIVVDLSFDGCSDYAEIGPIDCSDPDCSINDLIVEAHTCDDDGTFQVDVDFNPVQTGEEFILYYGIENTDLESDTFAYADLPVTVGTFDGDPTTTLFFKVYDTDNGCFENTLLEAPYCNDPHCLEFEELDGHLFSQENGYENGDTIGIENDVILTLLETSNEPSDFIQVLSTEEFPDFQDGVNSMLLLSHAGLGLDFTQISDPVVSVTIDFFYGGGNVAIGANGQPAITVNSLVNMPSNIAPGVNLNIEFFSDNQGTLTFTGDITYLFLYGWELVIDNACFTTIPDPEFCIELGAFEDINEPVQLAGPDDAGDPFYEEDGVVFLATNLTTGNNNDGILEDISVSNTQLCDGDFPAAVGPRFYLEGAMKLDFSGFDVLPNFVRFDYGYCPGTDGINLGVNDSDVFWGFFNDVPDQMGNVDIVVQPGNNAGTVGTVLLFGDIEYLTIGGIPVHIDNICFSGIPEEENVWPGDVNNNYEVNHFDLLGIGIAYELEGPERDQPGIDWTAYSAENWSGAFADGTNYKHADCIGDGNININDREAIVQNYGQTHGPVIPVTTLPGTDLDPPIFLDFPDPGEVGVGAPFEVPIVLGTEDIPMENIYGVAFTVELDPQVFSIPNLTLSYPASWFGEPGVNTMTIHKFYPAEGKIEIAITRTDMNNVSGYGPIAYLRGIIDDIAGVHETSLQISDIKAIQHNESLIPVYGPSTLLKILPKNQKIGKIDLQRNLRVFPNPTTDWVTLRNKYLLPIDQVDIFDSKGQPVKNTLYNTNQVSLEDLPAGIYMFRIRIGEIILNQKVVKVR